MVKLSAEEIEKEVSHPIRENMQVSAAIIPHSKLKWQMLLLVGTEKHAKQRFVVVQVQVEYKSHQRHFISRFSRLYSVNSATINDDLSDKSTSRATPTNYVPPRHRHSVNHTADMLDITRDHFDSDQAYAYPPTSDGGDDRLTDTSSINPGYGFDEDDEEDVEDGISNDKVCSNDALDSTSLLTYSRSLSRKSTARELHTLTGVLLVSRERYAVLLFVLCKRWLISWRSQRPSFHSSATIAPQSVTEAENSLAKKASARAVGCLLQTFASVFLANPFYLSIAGRKPERNVPEGYMDPVP